TARSRSCARTAAATCSTGASTTPTAATTTARCATACGSSSGLLIHGNVERRTSIYIPNLWIGSAVQEKLRDVVVTAVEGGHQWCDAFKVVGDVDVCTCTDNRFRAVVTAAASRVH